ncbi:hypothetical protein Tco_0767836 [Tanacetum coccineum]
MGTVSDVITGANGVQFNKVQYVLDVLNDPFSNEAKERYKADIQCIQYHSSGYDQRTSTHHQSLYAAKDIWENRLWKESNCDQLYAYLKQHEVHANENRIMMERFCQPNNDPLALVSDATVQQHIARECPRPKQLQDSDYFKDKMLLMQAQENGAVLDEEQLLFLTGEQVTNFDDDVDDPTENDLALNVDHIFEADQCDAFDSDVDEAPNIQTMFMVQDHDTFVDHMDEYREVYKMQNDVQHNYVVDSDAEYTSDSNVIPYNQYMEDNEEHVVQKLVGVYEQRAKFELTDRERKIDEQMRIIISDRNRKETSLKSELHSAQLQLRSTLNHHKIMREEAIILKKDFKQKEDKFLEEFLDIKRLKEKVEDRLYKQDQSVQTVHMICKPKSFYDEKHKVAIGYKNPVCLARAKQAQPALYNGHVLVTTNHTPPVIHDSEDTHNNNRKKAETLAPKPISALTVYPPNTPVKLVPRILPTKSQVKINLYVLTQLFTEFDKTCKTRITPSGLTEGERGFEQTKRCYLTEVIPFFKTLKEHFVGVQTTLVKEVKWWS